MSAASPPDSSGPPPKAEHQANPRRSKRRDSDFNVPALAIKTVVGSVLMTLALISLMLIMGFLQRQGALSFSAIGVVCAATSIILLMKAYHSANHRAKIACVLIASVTLILAFGGLFTIAARTSPTPQFAFDPRLLTEATTLAIDQANEQVSKDASLLAGLTALRSGLLFNKPDLAKDDVDLDLPGGFHFHRTLVSYPGPEYNDVEILEASITRPDGVKMDLVRKGLPGADPRIPFMQSLVDSRTTPKLDEAILNYITQVQRDHASLIEKTARTAMNDANLTVADYMYFSICTYTTIGCGDMIPAATLTRTLVAAEAICSVLMLTFGVDLLAREIVAARAKGA